METVTVTTKEELKEAQEEKIQEIIVSGDLANKLKKAKQITKLGATGLGVLTAALGIALIIAVFKDYEEISYENGKMTLRKRQS